MNRRVWNTDILPLFLHGTKRNYIWNKFGLDDHQTAISLSHISPRMLKQQRTEFSGNEVENAGNKKISFPDAIFSLTRQFSIWEIDIFSCTENAFLFPLAISHLETRIIGSKGEGPYPDPPGRWLVRKAGEGSGLDQSIQLCMSCSSCSIPCLLLLRNDSPCPNFESSFKEFITCSDSDCLFPWMVC